MFVGWNLDLSHFGQRYLYSLKSFLSCHWESPKTLFLMIIIAIADVADVGFGFHVRGLLDHCVRHVEAAVVVVVVGKRVLRSQRLVRQLV